MDYDSIIDVCRKKLVRSNEQNTHGGSPLHLKFRISADDTVVIPLARFTYGMN
jgi:hypothetical protein